MKIVLVCLGCLLFLSNVHARREHKAHEHGNAKLSIVIEGSKVNFVLECPAADIVGFEHKPKNEKEKKAAREAFEKLNEPNRILSLSQAQCKTTTQKVIGAVFEKQGVAMSDEDHSEIEVEYSLDCLKVEAFKDLKLTLFDSFNKVHKVSVQVVKEDKIYSAVLTNKVNKIPGL